MVKRQEFERETDLLLALGSCYELMSKGVTVRRGDDAGVLVRWKKAHASLWVASIGGYSWFGLASRERLAHVSCVYDAVSYTDSLVNSLIGRRSL